MHCNIRIKANSFYTVIFIMTCIIIFIFTFSSKGVFTLKKKEKIINQKEERIERLNGEISQISNNIDRLKTDKEYILSYAKTFGYIDSSKNEKIVKILKDERKSESKSSYVSISSISREQNNNPGKINVIGILILAIIMGLCLLFYIFMLTRNSQKRYG